MLYFIIIKYIRTGFGRNFNFFFTQRDQNGNCLLYTSLLLNVESDALMASLQEILKLSNEQLAVFTADFESRLPRYLRNALHPEAVAA